MPALFHKTFPHQKHNVVYTLILSIGLLFSMTAPVIPALAGETVEYDGTNDDVLQKVDFGGGEIYVLAPGGINHDGAVKTSLSGNRVTMNGGMVSYVIGSFNEADSNPVTSNNVTINDSTIDGGVYGGAGSNSGPATASNNSVTISHVTLTPSYNTPYDRVSGGNIGIYGGYARSTNGSATASGNTVTISGGTLEGTIPRFPDDVYFLRISGGNARSMSSSAMTKGNTVTINGGTVYGDLSGGSASSGFLEGYRLEINSNTGVMDVEHFTPIGPTTSDSATATGNTVTILGGTVYGDLSGGSASSGAATGSLPTTGDSGFTINSPAISGSAMATGNTITISGGTANGGVYGGSAMSIAYGDFITDTRNIIIGRGFATATGGSAMATGNTVIISGGTVNDGIYGGDARSYASGGSAESTGGSAMATGNTVIISGGTVNSDVYGGYASSSTFLDGSGFDGNPSGSAMATGNTVIISGNPTFGPNVGLYGGYAAGTTSDAFSGNVLNVQNYTGSPVASVQNFQHYNFIFPASQATPVLTVTGVATLGDGMGTGSTITASTSGDTPLRPGVKITLIDGNLDTTDFTQTRAQGQHSATRRYNWTLDTANGLVATLVSEEVNPQTKALSEGFVGGLSLVTQGGDMAAGQGMSQAVSAAQGAGAGAGLANFGAVSAGSVRYNSGSHVDTSSLSLLAGLSAGTELSPGHLTLGAFFEYGNGSYDTYNSFPNAASVHGDGNIYHLGGGVLGRLDFTSTGPGHFYTEGSFRAGKVYNEYGGSDLRDAAGRQASYDSSSVYYGLHLGTGYIWNITEAISLDFYGKYFWTRQGGDSVTLSTGDPVNFEDVNSHRLRLGSRLNYTVNEHISPYVGAAYEHEFDSQTKATTNGFDIEAPSLAGNTGIGEIGLNLKPSLNLPLSFDVGIQGYTGKREGVTGSLQIKWEF